MLLERQLLVGLLRDERHVLGRREECVDDALDRRQRSLGRSRRLAQDGDFRRLALRLPVGHRLLFGGRWLSLVELCELLQHFVKLLLVGLRRMIEIVRRHALLLEIRQCCLHFRRTDTSVMVGVNQLKGPKVKPYARRRACDRIPVLQVFAKLHRFFLSRRLTFRPTARTEDCFSKL